MATAGAAEGAYGRSSRRSVGRGGRWGGAPGEDAVGLHVDEDDVAIDELVHLRALEVDGRAEVGARVVDGDPVAERVELRRAAAGRERAVLLVLVPLEALVGVDEEEVGGDADLVAAAAVAVGEPAAGGELPQRGGDWAIVQEVGEARVGAPGAALDVVVEVGDDAGESENVGVGDLPVDDAAKIVDPRLVENSLHEDHTVPSERVEMLLRNRRAELWWLPFNHLNRKRDFGVLNTPMPVCDEFPHTQSRLRGRYSFSPFHL